MQDELMGYGASTLASAVASEYQLEFGFYLAILFAFVLTIGGIVEWGEG
jgi:hypothetical protein